MVAPSVLTISVAPMKSEPSVTSEPGERQAEAQDRAELAPRPAIRTA